MRPVGPHAGTTHCGDLKPDDRVDLRIRMTGGDQHTPVTVLFVERYPVHGRVRITFITDGGTRIARTRYADEPLSTIARPLPLALVAA